MQNKIENLFKEFFAFDKNITHNPSNPWQPPTDVYETPDEIVVKMSISGIKSDDIHVAFSDNILTISGYIPDTSHHEKTCFYLVEIRYGYFERSIFIPKSVVSDSIQATYKDGFLQILLPKTKQQPSETFSVKINYKQ